MTSPLAAQVSWIMPASAKSGDTLTVFYDPGDPDAAIKDPMSLVLHWGINEAVAGSGSWQPPPRALWPSGSIAYGDGKAVESPMSKDSNGTWSVRIITSKTVNSIHYVFHTGSSGVISGTENWEWDMNVLNGGHSWNYYLLQPLDYGSQQVEYFLDRDNSMLTVTHYLSK